MTNPTDEQFSLVRSIIHNCPALKLPQTFLQQIGMTAQIVQLHGLTQEQAQAIVDRLNAASPTAPPDTLKQALPTYYVRHPDGSYSIAESQPTPEQIAKQRNVYAQCDHKHGGSCCEDPHCWRVGNPEISPIDAGPREGLNP